MAKAFLSHSSSDKELVRKIANMLGNQRCVLDEISFEPGAKTLDEIFRELDASDVFVLFISDNALNSEWVQTEMKLAYKAMSEDKLDRILPIIIDKKVDHTDSRIPKWLSRNYNLRYIREVVIIYHKIRNALYGQWWNCWGNNHTDTIKYWTYGMTILGDPTIDFRYKVSDLCLSNLSLTTFPSNNTSNLVLYKAGNKITVSGNYIIPQGVHVIFDAPQVEFEENFSCPLGASFETRNEGCEL